jgi:nucleoid-associated protein YgaU
MPLLHGFDMKNPIATFTSIAAVAAAALGGTLYYKQNTVAPEPTAVVSTEVAKTPEAAPASEVPAKAETTTEVAVATPQPEAAPAVTPEPTPAPVAEVPKVEAVSPSFDTVRVEATGDAVIAGRAEPDADVTVKWNGNVVGTAKSNADGSFVVIPAKPLATGTGALTLEVSKNGAVTESEGSVIVAVKENAPALVAKVDPVAPTQVTQTGAATDAPKEVQLTAVDYDAAGNIVFSGKAAPSSVVRFYVDNAAVGEGTADAAGAWSFAGTSAVTPGTHTLRADAVDAAGKVLSRIELPFLREDAATVAAAQVAVAEPAVVPAPAVAAPEAPAVAATVEPVAEPAQQVAAAPAQPVVVEEEIKKLVIQPGNSLWKLSREVYGKGRMYTIIYEANRDQLKNPNKIFPGQILTAPKQN